MSDLFRRGSTWLQAWHEPAMVGLAVSLFGLAYLLPLTPPATPGLSSVDRSAVVPTATATATAFARGLYDIPAEDQYYRDRWIAETDAFYALNPPKVDTPTNESSSIRMASVRSPAHADDRVLSSEDPCSGSPEPVAVSEPVVAHAVHVEPVAAADIASPATSSADGEQVAGVVAEPAMVLSRRALRWRVVTCLAAGLLASLLFVSVWPAQQMQPVRQSGESRQFEIIGLSEAVPVRIPSAWIGMRPTVRQLARRGVVSGSYLLAICGAWGIVF